MISVVIPALNEAASVGQTIRAISQILEENKTAPFEILVVDDGSSDETGEIARLNGANVIRHPHRAGYGRSIKDGIIAAKYDTIIITDADSTYPAEAIPELLQKYREGFDMVVGARTGIHYHQSIIKMPLRWILRKLVEFTSSRNIPDINSGLRVFNKHTAITYFDHVCDTFSFTTSITLSYMMTGRFLAYMPITYAERVGKTKVRLISDSLKTFQYILEAAIYYNPLRIFLLASLVVLAGAFLSFVAALVTKLGVFYFIGIGAAVTSIIVLSLGMQTVLLRQIMRSSNEATPVQPKQSNALINPKPRSARGKRRKLAEPHSNN